MIESSGKAPAAVAALLHPARIRIVSLLEARPCTAGHLALVLPDIPTATLYRHLKILVETKLLRVENPPSGRPGPAERVYSVDRGATVLSLGDLAKLRRTPLRQYFATFVTSIIGDFDRYTQEPGYDLAADGVRFRKSPLRLDDDQHARFLADVDALLARYEKKANSAGRVRLFTHISVPSPHHSKERHENT